MSLASLASKSAGAPLAKQQRGAALILALVVVTIVVLLASTLTNDFLVTFKRVENQLLGKQAYAFMRGAEGIARQILQEDYIANTGKDHGSEGWLNQTVEFPMDYGAIAGTLCDMQSRLNLNRLVAKPGKYTLEQEMFIRLLQTLELDEPVDQQMAEDITHALSDWIDVDDDVNSTGGAEDGYYSTLDIPMHAANQPLKSSSELRFVKGITEEIYAALEPHVVVLTDTALLNVNTASPWLLRSINEAGLLQPLAESDAESIATERDGDSPGSTTINSLGNSIPLNGGFDDLAGFLAAHPATTLDTSPLAVSSEYFLLKTVTIYQEKSFKLFSVLHRDSDGLIKTVARGKSGFGDCESGDE